MRNAANTRTCVVCRKKFDKKLMTRVVKTADGYYIDESGKADGRGAYFCGSDECKKKLVKNAGLNKSFKARVPEEIYGELLGIKKEEL